MALEDMGWHVGRNVLVVGRVKGVQNGQFVHLEGPDGGDIAIDRSSSSRHYGSEFVEVYGTVNNDRSVTEIRSTDFGNNFAAASSAAALTVGLHFHLSSQEWPSYRFVHHILLTSCFKRTPATIKNFQLTFQIR
eukprot:547695-Hanusia_phi.AAC.1